jgi:bla regulator protein blaR1
MTGLLVHALVVAALLGGAAAALEPVARRTGLPLRALWLGALALTLWSGVLAPLAPLAVSGVALPRIELPVADVAVRVVEGAWGGSVGGGPGWERWVVYVWVGLSGVLLASLALAHVRLRLLTGGARWRRIGRARVATNSVAGPSAAGALRPAVHLPVWYGALTADARRLLYTHEAEHVRSSDPALTAGAMLALALLPWNPFVWWQAWRLRAAVELDCDARVLRRRPRPACYALLLIDVTARRRTLPALLRPALEGNQLERRIRAMTEKTLPKRGLRLAAHALLGGVLLAAACMADTPSAPDPRASAADAAVPAAGVQATLQVAGLGYVRGEIRDESGAPVPGAQVMIESPRIGALTGRNGRFLLINVPAGDVRLVISAPGMTTVVREAAVEAGRTTPVTAVLSGAR